MQQSMNSNLLMHHNSQSSQQANLLSSDNEISLEVSRAGMNASISEAKLQLFDILTFQLASTANGI